MKFLYENIFGLSAWSKSLSNPLDLFTIISNFLSSKSKHIENGLTWFTFSAYGINLLHYVHCWISFEEKSTSTSFFRKQPKKSILSSCPSLVIHHHHSYTHFFLYEIKELPYSGLVGVKINEMREKSARGKTQSTKNA